MKTNKIIYYTSTSILTAMTLMAVGMYFFQTAEIAAVFESIGMTGALVIPLGIAKLLGLTAIWIGKPQIIRELAFLAFGLVFVSAITAHLIAGDGQFFGPIIPLVLTTTSFIFNRKLSAGETDQLQAA